MNDYAIGDFGEAHFPVSRGAISGIRAHGFIKDMDGKYVMFCDNDDFHYLIRKDRFKFSKKEFKQT